MELGMDNLDLETGSRMGLDRVVQANHRQENHRPARGSRRLGKDNRKECHRGYHMGCHMAYRREPGNRKVSHKDLRDLDIRMVLDNHKWACRKELGTHKELGIHSCILESGKDIDIRKGSNCHHHRALKPGLFLKQK